MNAQQTWKYKINGEGVENGEETKRHLHSKTTRSKYLAPTYTVRTSLRGSTDLRAFPPKRSPSLWYSSDKTDSKFFVSKGARPSPRRSIRELSSHRFFILCRASHARSGRSNNTDLHCVSCSQVLIHVGRIIRVDYRITKGVNPTVIDGVACGAKDPTQIATR